MAEFFLEPIQNLLYSLMLRQKRAQNAHLRYVNCAFSLIFFSIELSSKKVSNRLLTKT